MCYLGHRRKEQWQKSKRDLDGRCACSLTRDFFAQEFPKDIDAHISINLYRQEFLKMCYYCAYVYDVCVGCMMWGCPCVRWVCEYMSMSYSVCIMCGWGICRINDMGEYLYNVWHVCIYMYCVGIFVYNVWYVGVCMTSVYGILCVYGCSLCVMCVWVSVWCKECLDDMCRCLYDVDVCMTYV